MEEIICWAFHCDSEHCGYEGLGRCSEIDRDGDCDPICPSCGRALEGNCHIPITKSGLMSLDLDTVIKLKEKLNIVVVQKVAEKGV